MFESVNFVRSEDGINFSIAVNEIHCGVLVESIDMFVGIEDDGDGYFGDGDLAVCWNMEGLTNDESAQTMGSLLLRNLHSDDDVTRVMGEFYWENGFTERLRELLVAHGFSAEAASNVFTSEWGMQDEGRASYDANAIADEVRKHFGIAVVAA